MFPPVLGKKKQYLYSEVSIHDFVNGIGIGPVLVLAASNHLSKARHHTCQGVMSSRNSAPWTGFEGLNEAKWKNRSS